MKMIHQGWWVQQFLTEHIAPDHPQESTNIQHHFVSIFRSSLKISMSKGRKLPKYYTRVYTSAVAQKIMAHHRNEETKSIGQS